MGMPRLFKRSMIGLRLPSVMKHRSSEPGTSTLQVAQPGLPVGLKLNFCRPNFSAISCPGSADSGKPPARIRANPLEEVAHGRTAGHLGNASQSFPVLKVEQDPLQTVEALLHAIDASLQAFQLSFRGRVFASDHLPFNDLGLLGHCQHSLS